MRRIDADELKKAFYMDDRNYSQPAIIALIDKAPTVPAEAHVVGHMNFEAEDVLELLHKKYAFPGEWIPCSDRLPEIGDTYIVTGKQKYPHEKDWKYFVDAADSHGGYIDDFWNTFNDWKEGQETHIIAWMPLPEPYSWKDTKNPEKLKTNGWERGDWWGTVRCPHCKEEYSNEIFYMGKIDRCPHCGAMIERSSDAV